MFQQFGLIFRAKFAQLGISNTETTTVINLNSAFNTGVGRYVIINALQYINCLLFDVSIL